MTIAERALEFIRDGQVVGLGTGRAATAFIEALGRRVRDGLRIRGVATSVETAALAARLGIPLLDLATTAEIDIAVDGADEVDPRLGLIKGLGGALVREKIVAAAAKRLVIVVGEEKLVKQLGERGKLPVEVLPVARAFCVKRIEALGIAAAPRIKEGRLYTSDNGNPVLDCVVGPIADPAALDRDILAIPGVIDTGLFLDMAHTVLVQRGDRVEILGRA